MGEVHFAINIDVLGLTEKEMTEIQKKFVDNLILKDSLTFEELDVLLNLKNRSFKMTTLKYPELVEPCLSKVPSFKRIEIEITG